MNEVEQKVILLLRDLKPYEVIEIKMSEGQITIVVKSTVREVFALDN